MKAECLAKLANVSKQSTYPALVQKLIVQGLIKIEESAVEIQCRAEDKAIVAKVVSRDHLTCIYFMLTRY